MGSTFERRNSGSKISHPVERYHEGSRFPREGQAQLTSRLEAPLQRELGAHAHRFTVRSSSSVEKSGLPQPQQTAIVPRKENAGTREVSVGERDGDGAQSDFGERRRIGSEVAGESKTAISSDAGEIRLSRQQH